ncbi:MAG TPA: hypothetical protein VNL77_02775 [Roseiflexaceae bacterium]|nr:hypothetical protein [Roseiflexaceae bacterium]
MAEPALDVAHFRAAVMDSGMNLADERTIQDDAACHAYLRRLDALGETFLSEYTAHAPVSRRRRRCGRASTTCATCCTSGPSPSQRGRMRSSVGTPRRTGALRPLHLPPTA